MRNTTEEILAATDMVGRTAQPKASRGALPRRNLRLAPRRPRWHADRILEPSVSGMENRMTDLVTLEIFSDYV